MDELEHILSDNLNQITALQNEHKEEIADLKESNSSFSKS